MRVNPDSGSNKREVLGVTDLDGGEAIGVTVASVEEVTFDGRKKLVLTFEQTGDKSLWLNVTSTRYMVEVYGDETDDWIGEPVALMRKQGDYEGRPYDNLWIASPEMWAHILKESGLKVPGHIAAKKAVLPKVAPAKVAPAAKRGTTRARGE